MSHGIEITTHNKFMSGPSNITLANFFDGDGLPDVHVGVVFGVENLVNNLKKMSHHLDSLGWTILNDQKITIWVYVNLHQCL